ncbi:PTS sugar transporter subunit IIA [Caproiciproducens galactitolivorans]|uniref:PTS sugar transporter subunit IIA n=1 Tax=Caproiciproducens galactitolivorans TaxID=642589 RepID=UPI001082F701|nr:PTS sugar transporter subunit IIA [Caproiciproducens galactitolivorans]QEY33763.1 PTS sugar transporter subunit IIA [Caproiciproducens galactitolivorans]
MIWKTLKKRLIVTNSEAESREEIFQTLGSLLIREGYCRDTYIQALKDREREYPTGLDMGEIGVAIPHTDASHVLKSAMAIAVLKKPVSFEVMGGDEGEIVNVSLVVAMAIRDTEAHLNQVQALLKILQDNSILRELISAESPEEVIHIIKGKEEKT